MANRFADLHCHPHSRAFQWMRHTRKERDQKRYHPWTVVLSNFKHQKAGKRAFTYSQCDPVKLWNGNVKLVFASLYPMEKGFFKGAGKVTGDVVKAGINKVADTSPEDLIEGNVGDAFKEFGDKVTGGENTFKDFFQAFLMKMPLRRINYIQSDDYDYYEELKLEYDFLKSRSGVQERSRVHVPFLKRIFAGVKKKKRKNPESLNATGTYVMVKNGDELRATDAAGHMAFILTIEGMHALGTDTNPGAVLDRIDEIKQWEHPVFFITFAHHFDNGLCGHAHSIIKSAALLTDQNQAMNGGFNDLGRQAARRLLALDEDNNHDPALGRRILLDLKHTSATSRKEYYNEIVKPCQAKGDVIPVIASHVAYSGIRTLADFERNYGKETDDYEVDDFNAWNINVCDEDIEMIVNTGGLLGLCFDQRILGQSKKDNVTSKDLVWASLEGILNAVSRSNDIPAADKARVWDILTIGTDFEGYIDPTDRYPTTLEFERFRSDLIDSINQKIITPGQSAKYFIEGGLTAERIADKVCFDNAHDFVLKHL